jgi:hypothetical protein
MILPAGPPPRRVPRAIPSQETAAIAETAAAAQASIKAERIKNAS